MERKFGLGDDHPLVRELASLRSAVKHYEQASQSASLQLQRQAFEIAAARETSRLVSQHNAYLENELETLRLRSEQTPLVDTLSTHAAELSLERIKEQLSATQAQVLAQNRTIADLKTANSRLEHHNNEMKLVVEDSRRREAAANASQRETQLALRQAVEERNMSDHVVREYADLVKSIDAKSFARSRSSLSTGPTPDAPIESPLSSNGNGAANDSVASKPTPLSSMVEGRQGLERLLRELNAETTRLHEELQHLHAQLEATKAELKASQSTGSDEFSRLADAQADLMRYQADDTAAAKLVSRYMSFSQSSTDVLQAALTSTKTRHAATVATFTARIEQAERAILNERAQSEKLRRALDDATQDISRATYGRRREISLRMALLVREERIVEDLRRWVRKTSEALDPAADLHEPPTQLNDSQSPHAVGPPEVDSMRASLVAALSAASEVLRSIDGQPPEDRKTEEPSNGSVARLILAQDTLASLVMDLQDETEGRLALVRQLHPGAMDPSSAKTLPSPPGAISETVDADAAHDDIAEANGHNGDGAGDDQASPSEKEDLEDFSAGTAAAPSVRTMQTDGCSEELRSNNGDICKITLPPTLESDDAPLGAPSIVFPSCSAELSRVSRDNTHLINKLDAVASRYEGIQRQLRECCRILAVLKSDYLSKQPHPSSRPSSPITQPLITTAIERLDDYAEDAIVEVEIRAADDIRLAEGFRTLLSVSGSSGVNENGAASTSVFEEIEAFLDESHFKYGVNFAKDNFMKKVNDLQHDIAAAKFALHQSPLISQKTADEVSLSPQPSERPGWSRWFSPPRVPSSRPTSPALVHQSFGAVMTSPTLRSSSSLSLKDTQQPAYSNIDEMIKQLDFRISMPFNHHTTLPEVGSDIPVMAPWARARTVSLVAPRPRAVSGTLGLGASSSRYDTSRLSQSHAPSERVQGYQDYNMYDGEDEDGGNNDSDVE